MKECFPVRVSTVNRLSTGPSRLSVLQKQLFVSQPLQRAQTEGKWGIAMAMETEDFDCGGFSSQGPQDIRTEVSTLCSYAAMQL